MNELFEGCNHNCEDCYCFDDCYYYNSISEPYKAVETGYVKDMVEVEVWNKENLCFEKRFVYERFSKRTHLA